MHTPSTHLSIHSPPSTLYFLHSSTHFPIYVHVRVHPLLHICTYIIVLFLTFLHPLQFIKMLYFCIPCHPCGASYPALHAVHAAQQQTCHISGKAPFHFPFFLFLPIPILKFSTFSPLNFTFLSHLSHSPSYFSCKIGLSLCLCLFHITFIVTFL